MVRLRVRGDAGGGPWARAGIELHQAAKGPHGAAAPPGAALAEQAGVPADDRHRPRAPRRPQQHRRHAVRPLRGPGLAAPSRAGAGLQAEGQHLARRLVPAQRHVRALRVPRQAAVRLARGCPPDPLLRDRGRGPGLLHGPPTSRAERGGRQRGRLPSLQRLAPRRRVGAVHAPAEVEPQAQEPDDGLCRPLLHGLCEELPTGGTRHARQGQAPLRQGRGTPVRAGLQVPAERCPGLRGGTVCISLEVRRFPGL
mmetsp:Transcript_75433/g.221178  ORF Transcript_75433/g.221178 Transcript_75433/m.221178 type:complete len:254 (-) Transcript_75433:130-891(-)